MPKPKPNESRDDYVARCIPIVLDEGTAEDQEQAVAVCDSMWQEAKKGATPHNRLLDLVRDRTEKQTEFNYGILTADRYVKRFLDEIGIQACYRHMCRTAGVWASFDDVMQKAAGTLSYINADMEVKAKGDGELPSSIERPKNTLMVFRHVLTTSTKDRDGDILRTKGAIPDPRMLMLWNHVHTLPIGKMLAVANHTKDELQLYSCIVDMNELCHDSAVMVDSGMARFSHGFRALDFLEIKEGRDSAGGFDVREFEILEESLVSVPANPDAEVEEVLLSLVEGGKLTSPLMKDYGRAVREHRPISIPVQLDVKMSFNGQEAKSDANEFRDKAREEGGRGTSPSEEAQTDVDEGRGEEKSTEDQEVKRVGMYAGDLDGSWEMIGQMLRGAAKVYLLGSGISVGEHDWVNVVGTYEDYAIVCIEREGRYEYYKVGWAMVEGVPSFHGEPKRVEIETTTEIIEKMKSLRDKAVGLELVKDKRMVCSECSYVGSGKDNKCPECGAKLTPRKDFVLEKAGRVLSKANEKKLREAIDDLEEVSKTDGIPRGCRALVKQAKRSLKGVVDSLGTDSGVEKNEPKIDAKQAMAVLLASGGEKELKVMLSMLKVIENGRRDDEMTKQYAEFLVSS